MEEQQIETARKGWREDKWNTQGKKGRDNTKHVGKDGRITKILCKKGLNKDK
jgi:hypothetical protein